MDSNSGQFSFQSIEFAEPALGDSGRVALAAILFDGSGIPQRAVVRGSLSEFEAVSAVSELEVARAVCQELRSIAEDPAALRTFVDSLGEASWSLRLSGPIALPATTLEGAIREVCRTVLRPT